MRVLLISNYFGSQLEIAARRNNIIAQGLQNNGHEVIVAHINKPVDYRQYFHSMGTGAFDVDNNFKYFPIRLSKLTLLTLSLYKSNSSLKKKIARALSVLGVIDHYIYSLPRILFEINKIISQHDVALIITSSPSFSCPLAGIILSVYKKIPMISDNRDLWASGDYNKSKIKALNSVRLGIEKIVHKSSVLVSFTSKSASEYYQRKFGINNVFFMYTGSVGKLESQSSLAVDNIITYAGSMYGGRRRLDLFLDALLMVEGSQSTSIYLIGDDVECFESFATNYPSLKFVVTGKLGKSTTDDYCHRSFFSILLHGDEDFDKLVIPGKFFEFLCLRKPIICVASPDTEIGLIIHKYNLGICSLSTTDLANFMRKCLRGEFSMPNSIPVELTSEANIRLLVEKINEIKYLT